MNLEENKNIVSTCNQNIMNIATCYFRRTRKFKYGSILNAKLDFTLCTFEIKAKIRKKIK